MVMARTLEASGRRRYDRDSLEFGRVVNLSDAVFAIALTLLVLNLEVPDVPAGELAGALGDQTPQLIAFALAFLLVANVWWLHHKICAALGWFEPGMIAVNVVGLAGVALVPFPTSLVGAAPSSRAAVLPFIGLFLLLSALWLVFALRAHAVGAWRRPLPPQLFPWMVTDWLASLAALVLALLVTLWQPVAGLVVLAVASGLVELTMGRLGPTERKMWF
jgi:uncharacterized membrane protein